MCGTRNPKLPRKRIPVLAHAPADRRSECLAEFVSQPRFALRHFSDLVIEQKIFQTSPQSPQFLALQPRKNVSSERESPPLFERLRLTQSHLFQLRPNRNSWVRRKDIRREADVGIFPSDVAHDAERLLAIGLGFSGIAEDY